MDTNLKGILKKKSPKSFLGISIWQDRLFMISESSIQYFKCDTDTDNVNAGEIHFDDIISIKGKPRSVEFSINTKNGRSYELAAQTVSEAQNWLSALSLCSNVAGSLVVEGLSANEVAAIKKKTNRSKEKPLEAEIVTASPEEIHLVDYLCCSVTVEFENNSSNKDIILSPFVALFAEKYKERPAIYTRNFSTLINPKPGSLNSSNSFPNKPELIHNSSSKASDNSSYKKSELTHYPSNKSTDPSYKSDTEFIFNPLDPSHIEVIKHRQEFDEEDEHTSSHPSPPRPESFYSPNNSRWVHLSSTETINQLSFPSKERVIQNSQLNIADFQNHNKFPLLFKLIIYIPLCVKEMIYSKSEKPITEVKLVVQDHTGRTSYSETVCKLDLFDTSNLRLCSFQTNTPGKNNYTQLHELLGVVDFPISDLLLGQKNAIHCIEKPFNIIDSKLLRGFDFKANLRFNILEVFRSPCSNTDRIVNKSFVSLTPLNDVLICHEGLEESPYSFRIPHMLLKISLAFHELHAKLLKDRVSDIDAYLKSKPILSSAVQSLIASGVEEDPYGIDKEKMNKLLDLVDNNLEYTSKIRQTTELFSAYAGKYRGLRFKPSNLKSNAWLSFLPINLHIQSFLMTTLPPSSYAAQNILKKFTSNFDLNIDNAIRRTITASNSFHMYSPMNASSYQESSLSNRNYSLDIVEEEESDEEEVGATERKISMISGVLTKVSPTSIPKSSPFNAGKIVHDHDFPPKPSIPAPPPPLNRINTPRSGPTISDYSISPLSSSFPKIHTVEDVLRMTKQFDTTSIQSIETTISAKSYDCITVGAFSAHHLKYKYGGVTQGMANYDKLLKQYPNETDALLHDVEHFQQTLQFRKEATFSQALTSCTTALVLQILRNYKTKPLVLERYLSCGFLFHFESLLSTFGDEIAMLSDHNYSMFFLRNVHFVLRRKPESATYDFNSDSFTPVHKLKEDHVPSFSETISEQIPVSDWSTSNQDSFISKASYLDPSIPHVIDINLHDVYPIIRQVKLSEANILHNKNAYIDRVNTKRGRTDVDDFSSTDNRFSAFPPTIIVDIFLPSIIYDSLPTTLKHPVDSNSPKSFDPNVRAVEPMIQVIPVMFTQGVNEMQTIANASGSDTEQYEINVYYAELLKGYLTRFKEVAASHEDVNCLIPEMMEDLAKLESIIHKSRGLKSLELLALSDSLTRRLHAGRGIGCKSAKDRTSMSTTWHHSRQMSTLFGLSQSQCSDFIDVMRIDGVRRINVRKNAGKPLFAFNSLQRSMLPLEFQAPEYCCGSVQS